MTVEELKDKIRDCEHYMGESWTDQGGVCGVDEWDYIEFLKAKGYADRIQEMIDDGEFLSYPSVIDWNDFMQLNPEYDGQEWSEENYNKNIELLAEFIISKGDIVLQMNLDWIDFKASGHKGSMTWDKKWNPEYYAETIKKYPQWAIDDKGNMPGDPDENDEEE